MKAPVNKIIPMSIVDGKGCRTSIFFQNCNLSCRYCHNPETQNLCNNCGDCVEGCPGRALYMEKGKVCWNESACLKCDRCIKVCRHNASPKVSLMTADEIISEIDRAYPFVRGITVSGGECMLYPEFLLELFIKVKGRSLSCYIDSNGSIDFSKYPELTEACDKVMLDVKAWDDNIYRTLTGGDASMAKKNLAYLAERDKLEEVRIVCLENTVDIEETITGIAKTLGERVKTVPLKLIRFRNQGVRGFLSMVSPPGIELMERWKAAAEKLGFNYIRIV